MSRTDPLPLSRERFLEYFRQAQKPRESWLVGMEMERMARHARTGRPLPYDGQSPSILEILRYLRQHRGGSPIYEGEHLIALDADWGSISLEPGGQVEWSSRPAADLAELEGHLQAHLEISTKAAEELGVRWIDLGVDPDHHVDEMPWMPKARYKIMRPYMGARGRLAHRMMTQTASIQCAYDFASPEDWTRKFKAAALMAPVAVALFANSSQVEGRDSGYRSFRQAIWRETAPERCGLPPVVFEPDFGMERWLDWICEVPSMFRYRVRGLVPCGGVPFSSLMEKQGCDALRDEDWELHLSSIFTDVRAYSYIEVRIADLLPPDLLMTVPTFWTGLLYHEDGLDAAQRLGESWDDYTAWVDALNAAGKQGLDASPGGRSLRECAAEILKVASANLGTAPCVGDVDASRAHLARLAARHDLTI
ncbi:hypothetical protein ABI59_09370 [Acidobacteria bacterium Mor1]|nr:hypothetical protein ABI59_09370 [Acidobacteria bacterium Mor1]